MSTDRNRPDPLELRRWLRRGDPAADGREPDRAELQRMRRALLEAAPAPAVRWARPAWALAATALLLALLGLWAVRRPGPPPAPQVADAVPERPVLAESAPGPGPSVAPEAAPAPEPEPVAIVAQATPAGDEPPPAVAAVDRPPQQAAERRTRQIQFTSPGGTKILWTLDSEFRLGT